MSRKNWILKTLVLSMFLAGFVVSCPGPVKNTPDSVDGGEENQLIKQILILDKNFKRNEVSFSSETTIFDDKVRVVVFPSDNIDAEALKVSGSFGGEDVKFNLRDEGMSKYFFTDELSGNVNDVKEAVVNASLGSVSNKKTFKVKFGDSSLPEMNLVSFKIGSQDVTGGIKNSPTWRLFDAETNKVKFSGSTDYDLSSVLVSINGKEIKGKIGAVEKKQFEFFIDFEKDKVTNIFIVFKSESAKDCRIPLFTMIFTNQTNTIISVDAAGMFNDMSEEMIFSKKAHFNVMQTEPKIKVRALKARKDKITKVTVDGEEVNIEDKSDASEAVYTLKPALTKAGEKRTVKLRIEGEKIDGSGVCDVTEMDITFELVQFIQAQSFIDSGSGYEQYTGSTVRVYIPNVKLKITADKDLKDAVLQGYQDADGTVPDFEISGKDAVVSLNLKDTGMEPLNFKVILKAEDRTDTVLRMSLRYTAQDDPLSIFQSMFERSHIDWKLSKRPEDNGGVALYVCNDEEAVWYALLGRDVDNLTSVKVNGNEVFNTSGVGIIKKAELSTNSGPGGVSKNLVITFGNFEKDKEYDVEIEAAGTSTKGKNLAPAKLPKFKIKMKSYAANDCTWRPIFNDGTPTILDDPSARVYSEGNWDKATYNEYGIKSVKLMVIPNNPKAKVKGYWYIISGDENKPTSDSDERWIKDFEKGEILGFKSDYCFTLNLKENLPMGIKLWVVAEDGITSSENYTGNDASMKPLGQLFNYVKVYWDYNAIPDPIPPSQINSLNTIGSETTVDKSRIQGDKLYFRAVTFTSQPNYRLYKIKPAENGIIKDFVHKDPNGLAYEYRFTVDVSKLTDNSLQELELALPVYIIRPNETEPSKKETLCFTYKGKIKS